MSITSSGPGIFGLNTRYPSFRFAAGGRFTTLVANVLYDSCLTDMHTCLKLLPVTDFRILALVEDGFGLDTQLTARLLRAGVRPYEVPVSYNGRSAAEGKKITWLDGVECLAILIKVRLRRRPTLPLPYRNQVVMSASEVDTMTTDVAIAASVADSDRSDLAEIETIVLPQ